ncbi:hypothetical protein [Phenylobacterium sp.]|mgnify:CR=1 FL=1|uniref:hypothetical protein n=1 Tax=Phenylobacterium sp. TaxID=1871053 RepID=UPI002FD9AE28
MNLKMILSAASAAALLTAGAASAQTMTDGADTGMATDTGASMTSPAGSADMDAQGAVNAPGEMDATRPASPAMTDAPMNDQWTSGQTQADDATQMGADAASESGVMASDTGMSGDAAAGATVTPSITANEPIPDTEENRELYGEPMSRSGQATEPRGN